MTQKHKNGKYRSQLPNDHISLGQQIALYEELIAKNKYKPNPGMNRRLIMLNKRMESFRIWQNIPYSKRRFITSPIKEITGLYLDENNEI